MSLGWALVGLLVVAANLFSFVQMGRDKRRARAGRGTRRLSERALLAPTLLCGDAGLLAGMFVFRHKTRKRSFQIAYAGSVLLRLVLLAGFAHLRA